MSGLRSKIILQFLVSNGATAANFALSIVLARLLNPTEIGIFSMTAIAVSFAHVFRDFGVVTFIKQQKELNSEIISSATGVLITTSWTIAAVLYLLSGYWADFFEEPGIRDVMHVLALGFVFIPFGAIPQAVLTRNFEVEKQAIVTLISTTTYITAAILFALEGFSYMSMAWANLVNIIVSGACYIALRPPEVTLHPSLKQWRQVVNFGTGAMLTSSLKAIDLALPDILLGRMSGPHQVGLFSRANSTVNILNHVAGPTISYVALPYLARVHHGGHDMAAEMRRVIAYVTGIFWPSLALIAVLADPIIVLLYGEAWRESATAMVWLCVSCAAQCTFSLAQPALTGIGRPYLSAIALVFAVAFKIILGILLYDDSLASFGMAVALADLLTIVPYLYLLRTYLGLSLGDIARSLARTAVVAAAVLAVTFVCRHFLLPATWDVAPTVIACVMIAAPIWYLAVRLTRHPLATELALLQGELRKRMAGSRNTPPVTTSASAPHIAVYGAVADTPVDASPQGVFPIRLKQYAKLRRDLLRYARKKMLMLDYRDYGGTHAYNVGDVAIAETIRRLFRASAPDCSFTNANWGHVESLRQTHRSKPIDLLVVAGSGYFQFDQAGKLSSHLADDLAFLAETGIPYVFFGIGINQPFSFEGRGTELQPDSASEALMRSLLGGAMLISVRDEYSMQKLSCYTDKPVHLVGDPALHVAQMIDIERPPAREKSSPVIGLNFSFHGPTSNRLFLKNLPAYASALLDIQKKTGCRFQYIVHHGSEYPIPHLLRKKGLLVETVHAELTTTSRAYQDIDLHIGGMLHSCILSASAGTPWIAIAYDIKHQGFNRMMGMDDYYQDAVSFSESALSSLALESLRNRDALRAGIAARRVELRERIARITQSVMAGLRTP